MTTRPLASARTGEPPALTSPHVAEADLDWRVALPGAWLRNFRLGEWLDGPVTPLFESWALTGIERRMHATYESWIGIKAPEPAHVVVNGWYYYGFNFMPADRRAMAVDLVRHILPSFILRPRRAAMAFPPLARFGIGLAHDEWRRTTQPAYRAQVAAAEAALNGADANRLISLLDELVTAAGTYFTSLTTVAGYATKSALPLARLYRDRVYPRIGGSFLDLLAGLGDGPLPADGHLVSSLDWIVQPKRADIDRAAAEARFHAARAMRRDAEVRARAALAAEPKQLARFERLLAGAQRFDRVREEQAREFTLAWPVMRAAVVRLGESLMATRRLEVADDIHFLTRDEVVRAVGGNGAELSALARDRRSVWNRQRDLVPPLQIGTVPPLFARLLDDAVAAIRMPAEDGAALVGVPASGGKERGPAQIVRGPADFDRVMPGDVLVASMTTPAWMPLFDRVVAVVTDNGGVGAHASIVAREYGIPAVVGLGDVTLRLRNGELIEVDGGAGTIRRIASV